jgi:photosystem II stability/assembly factor-like uncharacterized protein
MNTLTYGNNLWVATGSFFSSNFALLPVLQTSTNAINWVTQNSNFGNTLIFSLAYGDNLWVAGGLSGQLRTSTNAITWVTQTSNFGNTAIDSVAYGNNLWVAVGSFGQLRTSTDTITWVTQTSDFGNTNIQSIDYGDNLWVAGGSFGQINTAKYIPIDGNLTFSDYSNNLFSSTDGFVYESDERGVEQIPTNISDELTEVYRNSSDGSALLKGNSGIYYSTDLTTWTTISTSENPSDITDIDFW